MREDLKNQAILNQLQNQQAPVVSQPSMSIGLNQCPQCGLIHPPLQEGQKCPNAPLEIIDNQGNRLKIDTEKYFLTLRNVLFSQVESKKIKDVDLLFKKLTVETMNFLEKYKE